MNEQDIIRQFQSLNQLNPRIQLGIGDDAALIQPGSQTLVWTVDTLVEDTHFLRQMPAAQIAYKSLAVNLSDLAAMNAEPLAALLSLSLPPDLDYHWIQDFSQGLLAACQQFGVTLAGGDTVRSREIQISISLLGESPRPVTRYQSQAGDLLVLSGHLGASAAGLTLFQRHLNREPAFCGEFEDPLEQTLWQRHWQVTPRFAEARTLATQCSRLALLDTSDGLARSVQLLCQANQLGCRIKAQSLPLDPSLQEALNQGLFQLQTAQNWVINGGEDYELLAAIPADQADWLQTDARFTVIGHLTQDPAQIIEDGGQSIDLTSGNWGYQHF